MLGVFIGAACLIGLCKIARRRRFGRWGHHGHYGGPWGARGGCGGGWQGGPYGYDGPEGWDDDDGFSPWEARRGGGFFGLRAFFARLETTPGQEKAIKSALSELRTKGRAVKDDVRGMRGDLATAFRGESLDAETLGTVASRASGATDALRDAAIGAVLKVHDALDERQRGLVADLLESGPHAWRGGWRGRRGSPLET
jgi:uncharacterized membrane protein